MPYDSFTTAILIWLLNQNEGERFFKKYHEEGISYDLSAPDTYLHFLNNFYMELTAKLIQLLPLQTGSGKNGQWKKQDIIVETDGNYPKKVCISIWGDKINESILKIGSQLSISFDVESREYNGKWYTDVKAWKVEVANAAGALTITDKAPDDQVYFDEGQMESKDDLPF